MKRTLMVLMMGALAATVVSAHDGHKHPPAKSAPAAAAKAPVKAAPSQSRLVKATPLQTKSMPGKQSVNGAAEDRRRPHFPDYPPPRDAPASCARASDPRDARPRRGAA